MDIRGAVDAAVPTNIIAAKAAEVRANKVNWQSYLQWVNVRQPSPPLPQTEISIKRLLLIIPLYVS